MNRLNQLIVIFIFTLILFSCQPKKKEEFTSIEDIEKSENIIISMVDKEQIKSHNSCSGKEKGSSCNYCFHTEGLGDDCMCDDHPNDPDLKICRIKDDKKGKFQEKADNFCSVGENNGKNCYYCGNDEQNDWTKNKKACVCSGNKCVKNE